MAVFVISGPSGVGKNTILDEVLRQIPELKYGSSLTTREPRPNDVPGKYKHVSQPEFLRKVATGKLLEWAQYGDHLYGTLKPDLKQELILEIDVQGAALIKEKLPFAKLIFIEPPGTTLQQRLKVLKKRLENRGTDTPETIRKRLIQAESELIKGQEQSDFVVTNHSVEEAIQVVVDYISSEMRLNVSV